MDPVQQFAIKAAEVAGQMICIDKNDIYGRNPQWKSFVQCLLHVTCNILVIVLYLSF